MKRPLRTVLLLIAVFGCRMLSARGEERPAVGLWSFENNLKDRSGRGNEGFLESATFVAGHSGLGLRCDQKPVIVPDSEELRPAPGLRIDCWVKLDAFGKSWQELLMKDRAYQLRVDPAQEGGCFAFFLNTGGWEPRVRSKAPAKLGQWYHLGAGWNGKETWLEVDGQRTSVRRTGVPTVSGEPLELGQFQGVLDEVRIENPAARPSGVAQWLFDGDLRDSSGHDRHLTRKDASFIPVTGGQALRCGPGGVQVASHSDLQLAPGWRLDCSVCFEKVPAQGAMIAIKNGEYQLRLNSAKEGSCFALFLNLDGWEPRITSEEAIEPGKWYRLTASWTGTTLTFDVNGRRFRLARSGLAKPTDSPLVIGTRDVCIDNLKLENPRLPMLLVRDARQEHAILLAGRPEKFVTTIRNLGVPAEQVAVRFKVPTGTRLSGPTTHELGAVPTGDTRTIEWCVTAERAVVGAAEIQVTAAEAPAITARHPLVFFASEDGPPAAAAARLPINAPGDSKAATFYIDSLGGNNANAGTSPDAAWKDFTKINGRVLGPGERLLLRRGSVFIQELQVSANGTADNWAEIGAYGGGARPTIRRNWDIAERCALVQNPNFLRIRSLTVCYAGKGLIVHYTESGHRGLVIEDCIAHHIEGLYRFNSHGIPEWRDQRGPEGDGLNHSSGIAIAGVPARDLVLRDCETFQCSSGWHANGEDVVVERVFCHDNYAHNTSPHPFLVAVRRAILRDSIFDASGWHASAGTMGIMLGDPQGLIIRNCVFRNQPDSGSHDEGGIDFENRGNGCLIDHCTFENNAGAAIEVLGLKSPQTTNIEIRDSRFIKNNTAKKLGPAEVFVWGRARDPSICCSTGTVSGNGYVLLPGIQFFTNEAPRLTSWVLSDNKEYKTIADMDRAMPYNRPPVVDAGPDVRSDQRKVALASRVNDDGLPAGQRLSITWEVLEGPGLVCFEDAHAAATAATFDKPGDYLLRLVAHDGQLWLSDMMVVHILPAGTSVVAAWEFNRNLDKEGWIELNPGTRVEQYPSQSWPTTSHPVKLVAGGYYVLAIDKSADAQLLSADQLGVELTGREKLVIHFQNHTPAGQMRLRFTTAADESWNDAKSLVFPVAANDNASRAYTLDLSAVSGWKGRLRQLRLDLSDGKPLTGTCRFDYLWIVRQR